MKKTIKMTIAILAASLFFAGCANDAQPSEIDVTQTSSPTMTASPTSTPLDIYYDSLEVKYIRTNGYIDGREYPISSLVESEEDLAQYIDTYKDDYYFDQASGNNISFYEATEEYDAEFFESHVIILVLLEEGSGSIRHGVTGIYIDDSTITVDITRIVPEVGTDDMAEWHILIELPREGISSQEVEVNITE